MRSIYCAQYSEEWYACKIGIPSASNFDKIITTKGDRSKQREKYLYQLAGERITGRTEESYQSAAMSRGLEMEDEARKLYEMLTGEPVVQIGCCITEGKTIYAASPDGLVGDDGLTEIKCPIMTTHVTYLMDNKAPTDYFQQRQGQLLVTERKWVDFISYYPAMKPLIVRVERDEQFIALLKKELETFCVELDYITNKIR